MKLEAKTVLAVAGIAIGQDFDTLTRDQLAALSAEAEEMYRRKYAKPLPANSAKLVRSRYELLQQRASA